MVTFLSAQNWKQAENRMFLQRTLGRVVDILLAFLIKQLFHSRFYFFLTVGYKMISTANSALRASIHKSCSDSEETQGGWFKNDCGKNTRKINKGTKSKYQRRRGRVVDILLAFLIKQLFHSRFYFFLTVGYKMISTANSALRASIHKSCSDSEETQGGWFKNDCGKNTRKINKGTKPKYQTRWLINPRLLAV